MFSSLTDLSSGRKQELVASLSALLVGSCTSQVTADAITAVAEASGNTISPAYATLFSSIISINGGIDKFCAGPGGGGGGGGAVSASAGGPAASSAKAEEKPEEKEEEEEMDLGGGMDMFGGGGAGGGGDY